MKLSPTKKPLFCYFTMVYATISIGALSITVGAHHLFATGAVLLPLFIFMTFAIAVPVAVLASIRGIGLCWAQTFLIHHRARPDVLPAGDLGIRAAAIPWRFNAVPTPGAVAARAATWRPYPSYPAAMPWRSLIRGAKESDPKAPALLVEASRFAAKQEPR
jgi:hypothetical protein